MSWDFDAYYIQLGFLEKFLPCFSLFSSSGQVFLRRTASEPLENGKILTQGSSFSYQEVLSGLVGYIPGGPGMAMDEFQFSLSDGLYRDTGRIEIYVDLPSGDTPQLAVNRGLQLSTGTTEWKHVAIFFCLYFFFVSV